MNFTALNLSGNRGNSAAAGHFARWQQWQPWMVGIAVFLLAAVQAALPLDVWAQPPDADVDFYVLPSEDTTPFTVGDQITLRLEVTHPAASNVELPRLDETWDEFEVISQTGQRTSNNNDGTATTYKDIVVSLFEPGQYQTPPLLVTHFKADDSMEELGAPVIPLRIESILKEGDAELRDLKPQADMPVPPLWPYILAGVVLATAVSGGLFWAGQWAYNRWFRKEPIPVAPEPFIDPRPPEVVALSELDRIESLNLPAKDQLKDHYSLVTDCLRQYIEGRYHLPALEQTTEELRNAFRKTAVSREYVSKFLQLFSRSDLVKFARFRPDIGEAYKLTAEARSVIKETTPRPEPPVTEAGSPELPPPNGNNPNLPGMEKKEQ